MKTRPHAHALTAAVVLGLLVSMPSAGAASSFGWDIARLIETEQGDAGPPQVSVDGSGNAIAVWHQHDGTRNNIWSNLYLIGIGWSTPQLIETSHEDATYPQVAVDVHGNAVAVWEQYDDLRYNVWSNRYVVGAGWGTAQPIETDTQTICALIDCRPQVAVDDQGNAVVVWQKCDGDWVHIWANRYETGDGWGVAHLIETNPEGDNSPPQVAVDDQGNAVVVWIEWDNIWSNRYDVETGWGTEQIIEANDGQIDALAVAVDGSGNATAIWSQMEDEDFNIWSSRYVVGAGWGTALVIEERLGYASYPDIAADEQGNAVAIWSEWDGTQYNIWSSRYVIEAGWSTTQLIETEPGGAFGAQVAVDSLGNAVAVWYKWNGTHCDIRSNRYVAGTGWGTAQLIETDDSGHAFDPQVAVDDSGNATVVWRQYDGTHYSIWSNRYTVGIEDRESQNPVLTVVMVTIATVAVVMSVMYIQFRRKMSRRGNEPAEEDPPRPQA